jgi:bifunctional N-acetylglucosamine-1-phosphate-uridyltransferase/glucosamine-1-phosphate-acetyltransferase GlmU-like protein
MNVLILAAGYATRLYPLTENKAKPLLEVAGKPMIEWVLDNLAPIPDLGHERQVRERFSGVGRRLYEVTPQSHVQDRERWFAQ